MKNGLKLAVSIAIPLIVGMTASLFTDTGEGTWYRQIQKPEWNPPGWIFGPVWTTLYIMMGIALYLVWKKEGAQTEKRNAIILWSVQMTLNFLWSLIFFGMQNIGGALVEIIILWLSILLTIFAFARISKTAAWLMVPYISWVSFAAILNYTIWTMNS